ncbi:helix-turn-helix domain-containing protein [Rhabdothermincola salaria]|uniref:helix-turn-helix domain-containing protein n=1 Tax=Rhabdothermincola salaria TaxID=2903142 RepID=UPI001E6032BA|nr:helix-turn-helix transcriptional regulator [Rhabdothermincola salaria]MCD9622832.1 helix-turn-helix transcriptional regulator [Rhabdothermincola salaria]
MTLASALLKQARISAGASCRGLARRAQVAPARISEIEHAKHDPGVGTLEHTLGAIGWQLAALPTRAPTAAAVALAISDGAAPGHPAGDSDAAFRALLALSDGLASVDAATRIALCVAPPPPTGDQRIDAAIAAIVEYHLEGAGVLPEWVDGPGRVLTEAWIPDPYAGPDIVDEAPQAFRRHGVLLAEAELASV